MDVLKAEIERKRKLLEEKELLAVRAKEQASDGLPRRAVVGRSPSGALARGNLDYLEREMALKGERTRFSPFWLPFRGAWNPGEPSSPSPAYLTGLLLWEDRLKRPLEEEIRIV